MHMPGNESLSKNATCQAQRIGQMSRRHRAASSSQREQWWLWAHWGEDTEAGWGCWDGVRTLSWGEDAEMGWGCCVGVCYSKFGLWRRETFQFYLTLCFVPLQIVKSWNGNSSRKKNQTLPSGKTGRKQLGLTARLCPGGAQPNTCPNWWNSAW